MSTQPVWNGRDGTAGGKEFGDALAAFAAERDVTLEMLGDAAGLAPQEIRTVIAGDRRVGISALARFALALRSKPMEFLQRTAVLSPQTYAFGLDPLYFLPEGPVRYDARIYMREINPRHRVPEADMTRRNVTLKAIGEDAVLDALGKTEVELAYLLRAAVQATGDSL
jgi:hypothetical protein